MLYGVHHSENLPCCTTVQSSRLIVLTRHAKQHYLSITGGEAQNFTPWRRFAPAHIPAKHVETLLGLSSPFLRRISSLRGNCQSRCDDGARTRASPCTQANRGRRITIFSPGLRPGEAVAVQACLHVKCGAGGDGQAQTRRGQETRRKRRNVVFRLLAVHHIAEYL